MEVFLRKSVLPLLLGAVITSAGCSPGGYGPNDWREKYTDSSHGTTTIIGRVLVPQPDYAVVARWLTLQKLREGNQVERGQRIDIEPDGWFNTSLEPGTYCLISYTDSNKRMSSFQISVIPVVVKDRTLRVAAGFDVCDGSGPTYVGTLVSDSYGRWSVKDEYESATHKLSTVFPSCGTELVTRLAELKERR